MNTFKQEVGAYFDTKYPSFFRQQAGESLKFYEFCQVKWYEKAHIGTYGAMVKLLFGKNYQLNSYAGVDRMEKLRNYRLRTIYRECIHYLHIPPTLLCFMLPANSEFQFLTFTLLNIFGNLYPIMLQRYNRIRVDDILKGSSPDV